MPASLWIELPDGSVGLRADPLQRQLLALDALKGREHIQQLMRKVWMPLKDQLPRPLRLQHRRPRGGPHQQRQQFGQGQHEPAAGSQRTRQQQEDLLAQKVQSLQLMAAAEPARQQQRPLPLLLKHIAKHQALAHAQLSAQLAGAPGGGKAQEPIPPGVALPAPLPGAPIEALAPGPPALGKTLPGRGRRAIELDHLHGCPRGGAS